HSAQFTAKTLPQYLGVSPWLIWAVMVLVAIGGFALGRVLERRTHGVITAEDIVDETDPTISFDGEGSAVHGNLGSRAA
ncbi:MAG: hypothetical protein IE913_10910, partial [Halothiobacillus sp.]|nr:hypothetical protein [Halothiobacillus sp.]